MPIYPRLRVLLLGATALLSLSSALLAQVPATPGVAWEDLPSVPSDGAIPPVRQVVLSDAGLAEYTRVVEAERLEDGEERLLLPTRSADIDDALKSLLFWGEGVLGAEMRLPSASVVDDVFTGLPFSPDDVASLHTLLSRFPGARVHAVVRHPEDGERRLVGRIMGVSQPSGCPEGETCAHVLTIRTEDGGMERITLDDTASVALQEADARETVERGLDVLAQESGTTSRTIEAQVRAAPGSGPVFVSAVFAAPVWRTAYRAAIGAQGQADFQAWAVVENATQEDWVDVEMTLASGSPRTLRADLYARRYGARERMDAAPVAQHSLFMAAPASAQERSAGSGAIAAAEMDLSTMDLASEGTDALVGARFALKDPVSVRAGEVLSVPFLGGDFQAEAIAYGRLDRMGDGPNLSPLPLALDVRNTTTARLPSGVLTVYDQDTGFAGDTQVPVMEPGSRHSLVFSQDSGTKAAQTVRVDRQVRAVAPGDGVLRITTDVITTRSLRVEGPAHKSSRVVLDQPFSEAENLTWTVGDGEQITVGDGRRVVRFTQMLDPGAVWSFSTKSVSPERSEWYVGDIGEEQLIALSAQAPDPETKAWLQQAARLRQSVRTAQEALEKTGQERAQAVLDQERRRGMVEAMGPGTPAYERFVAEILAAEDKIADLDQEQSGQKSALEKARADFSAFLSE